MEREWTHLINPFERSTEGSYKNALEISTWHDNALYGVHTDPFYGPLYTYFHPFHLAFYNAYTNLSQQRDEQSGKTLSLSQLISLLSSSKAKQWDVATQVVYPQGTAAYKNLFTHHRVPFQQGTQLERINAVKTLSQKLAGDAALATTLTDVNNFLTQLEAAESTLSTSKSVTPVTSGNVETARVNMCVAMFSNFGAMLQKFASTPESIASYFDIATIRSGSQVHFTGHLKPLTQHCVCKHTFAAADKIKVKNESTVALQVYLSSAVNATTAKTIVPVVMPITVAANTTETINASQLGNLSSTNLMISNPDAHVIAQWEITIE